jgi:hydrogen peroxide-dependent heme synthase
MDPVTPSADPVTPSVGWAVTHLYFRVHPGRSHDLGQSGKELVSALEQFEAAPHHQVLCSSVLGLKADLGVMALGPDLSRHDALARALGAMPALEPVYSFFSLTEASEYMESVEDVRARLEAQGVRDDIDQRLAKAEQRIAKLYEDRLHPRLPRPALLAFYPMSKAREPGANWYRLPFEERRELMGGHGKVGRRYTGRVLQLITGATGLDDYEWGVTLFGQHPDDLKEVVYTMRYDRASAIYAEFGPFYAGMVTPLDELLAGS